MRELIINAINEWLQNNHDNPDNGWQSLFLEFMRDNGLGVENAKSIDDIIENIGYEDSYQVFQQLVLVPLKNQESFFIGSCSKGLFVVVSETDAKKASEFYMSRINSEKRHLDNLEKVMRNYVIEIDND